ncbi:MAG: phosphodiester glycosidase family protein [Eubacteriales bacterium]|nr:phosphodiester glycosidase family protein [Eubacteriales bacterium]
MGKLRTLAVIIGTLIAMGLAFCFLIPVRLVVDIDPVKAADFSLLEKTDVRVYPSPLLKRGVETRNFKFKKEQGKESGVAFEDLVITVGQLQRRIPLKDLSLKSLSAVYMGTAEEGSAIQKSRINAVAEFEDGRTETISDVTVYSQSDTIQRSEPITVGTPYGITLLQLSFAQISQIKAEYTQTAYAGTAFSQDNVSVNIVYADGTTEPVTVFTCEGAKTFSGKCTYIVYTAYGKTTFEVEPTQIRYATVDDIYYAGEEFSGQMTVTWKDGTVGTVDSSEVSFTEGNTLEEGVNKIAFKLRGANANLYVNARKQTNVSNAKEQYADEVEHSNYNTITESVFLTIRNIEAELPYTITHVVVNQPSQISVVSANNAIGGGLEAPDTAATRTGWLAAINGSFFDTSTGIPLSSCLIRNGMVIIDGYSSGREICIMQGGALYSPPAGISAQDLLAVGVRDIVVSTDPLLMQDGISTVEGAFDLTGLYPRTAIGMVSPGNYYFVSATGTGLSYAHLQQIFQNLGCTYARPLDGGSSVSLYYGQQAVLTGANRAVADYVAVFG